MTRAEWIHIEELVVKFCDEPPPLTGKVKIRAFKNMSNHIVTIISEAELADQLGQPRERFAQWRKEGKLKYPTHFATGPRGQIQLTYEGTEEVRRLLALPDSPLVSGDVPEIVRVLVTGAGVTSRLLRGRVIETKHRCTIQLTGRNVFTHQFLAGMKLEVMPTATAHIYRYAGKAPQRKRL